MLDRRARSPSEPVSYLVMFTSIQPGSGHHPCPWCNGVIGVVGCMIIKAGEERRRYLKITRRLSLASSGIDRSVHEGVHCATERRSNDHTAAEKEVPRCSGLDDKRYTLTSGIACEVFHLSRDAAHPGQTPRNRACDISQYPSTSETHTLRTGVRRRRGPCFAGQIPRNIATSLGWNFVLYLNASITHSPGTSGPPPTPSSSSTTCPDIEKILQRPRSQLLPCE